MTSHDQEEWWSIVQDLREDQEAIAETWKESRKQYHDLNTSCDQLIQSLWVVHSLNFSLQKVFSHRLAPCEWIMSRDEASAIQFVNSTQVLSTNLQDSYSRFLDDLRTHPEVMAEVIQWVGNEGLDSTHFAHDVISVIYGHCLFKEDHEFLLTTLLHLFQDHVNHCSNYKDLFSIEPVCSRFITEYCHQLPSLKVFLTQVLRQPLQRIVVQSSRYLEYEVSKISTRFPEDTSVDLNEYATISSQQIAQFCMEILYQLNKHQNHFPPSLKWLLGSLKNLILQKWPSISPSFLRRPISYVLFGFIISSAFINSDLMGVLDIHIAMNDVALHNISQVIGVLQGCAWIVDKLDRTDYPMRHVVSQMDMVFFNALIDSIDSGLNDNINPPVSSLLPGLCRSVFLWSKDQLDDIVGTINDANCSFMELPEPSPRHVQLNEIVSVIPNMVVQKVRRNPYSFSVKNIMKAGSHPYLNRDDLQVPPTVKSPKHKRNKQRSRSVWGAEKPSLVDIGKSNTIQYTRNISKSESNPNVPSICLSPSGIDDVFEEQTPQEVIVLPIGRGTTSAPLTPSKTSWDIELMSEEEVSVDCDDKHSAV